MTSDIHFAEGWSQLHRSSIEAEYAPQGAELKRKQDRRSGSCLSSRSLGQFVLPL